MSQRKAYRASVFHCIADPGVVGAERSYEYFEDGLLMVEDGMVVLDCHLIQSRTVAGIVVVSLRKVGF